MHRKFSSEMTEKSKRHIPVEIRRTVLVESGHRCAIPTCRQTPVEVHHIIPWEKCKSHEVGNLIGLCPNCHTRAHKGEIDRKSLQRYKQLLADSSSALDSVFDHGVVSEGTVTLNRADGKVHELTVSGTISIEIGEWERVSDSLVLKIRNTGSHAITWNGFTELPFSDGFHFKDHGLSVIEISHYGGETFFKPISTEKK